MICSNNVVYRQYFCGRCCCSFLLVIFFFLVLVAEVVVVVSMTAVGVGVGDATNWKEQRRNLLPLQHLLKMMFCLQNDLVKVQPDQKYSVMEELMMLLL